VEVSSAMYNQLLRCEREEIAVLPDRTQHRPDGDPKQACHTYVAGGANAEHAGLQACSGAERSSFQSIDIIPHKQERSEPGHSPPVGVNPEPHKRHVHGGFQRREDKCYPLGKARFLRSFPFANRRGVDTDAGVVHEDITVDEARVHRARHPCNQHLPGLIHRVDSHIFREVIQSADRQHRQYGLAPEGHRCYSIYRSISTAGHQNVAALLQRRPRAHRRVAFAEVFANLESRSSQACLRLMQKGEPAAVARTRVVNEAVAAHNEIYNTDMSREKELQERIRQLEELNSTLQDKLDMIYSILAPDYEETDAAGDFEDAEDDGAESGPRLVQIDIPKRPS
jgi:hypothetical protein